MPQSKGPAPSGFWVGGEQEMLLMKATLAQIPRKVLTAIDKELLAEIVGEGKLSAASVTSKLTQLVQQGRQSVADHNTRERAGNDNTAVGNGRSKSSAHNGNSLTGARSLARTSAANNDPNARVSRSNVPNINATSSTRLRKSDASVPNVEKEGRSKKRKRDNRRSIHQTSTNTQPEGGNTLTSNLQQEGVQSSGFQLIGHNKDFAIDVEMLSDNEIGPRVFARPIKQETAPAWAKTMISADDPALFCPGKRRTVHDDRFSSPAEDDQTTEVDANIGREILNCRAQSPPEEHSEAPVIQQKAVRTGSYSIHRRHVAYKTRHWQDPIIRELSVTPGRY